MSKYNFGGALCYLCAPRDCAAWGSLYPTFAKLRHHDQEALIPIQYVT